VGERRAAYDHGSDGSNAGNKDGNAFEQMARALDMARMENERRSLEKTDILIRPDTESVTPVVSLVSARLRRRGTAPHNRKRVVDAVGAVGRRMGGICEESRRAQSTLSTRVAGNTRKIWRRKWDLSSTCPSATGKSIFVYSESHRPQIYVLFPVQCKRL
jgi:hypothetical protein